MVSFNYSYNRNKSSSGHGKNGCLPNDVPTLILNSNEYIILDDSELVINQYEEYVEYGTSYISIESDNSLYKYVINWDRNFQTKYVLNPGFFYKVKIEYNKRQLPTE